MPATRNAYFLPWSRRVIPAAFRLRAIMLSSTENWKAFRNLLQKVYSDVCKPPRALLILGRNMSRWKNWIVVFIALWLPLQGYGAVAMPFCEHGPAMPDSSVAVSAHVGVQHGHQGHTGIAHDEHEADSQSASSDISTDRHAGLGCNDCGACQLACAPLIVSTVTYFATTGSPVYDRLPVASLASISPEQLQRPPLPAFV